MERVRFIEHRKVPILYVDYSGIESSAELRDAVHGVTSFMRTQPLKSLLVLVDLTGVPYSLENVAILRHAVAQNGPFVRARAVFGLPPIASLSFSAVAQISGAKMKSFADAPSAIDWLASEG